MLVNQLEQEGMISWSPTYFRSSTNQWTLC